MCGGNKMLKRQENIYPGFRHTKYGNPKLIAHIEQNYLKNNREFFGLIYYLIKNPTTKIEVHSLCVSIRIHQ